MTPTRHGSINDELGPVSRPGSVQLAPRRLQAGSFRPIDWGVTFVTVRPTAPLESPPHPAPPPASCSRRHACPSSWEATLKARPLLVPMVTRVPEQPRPVSSTQLRLQCGEVQVEILDAAAVSPTWLAARLREFGAQR